MVRAALILLVVASAAAARADDACLAGGSTLGDQHALAYIHDGIESSCPCATYTGAPGFNRTAYRRCAKPIRDAALRDGILRSKCKRTATTQYAQSTCGTTKIACGQVKASSVKKPVRCLIKATERCHDGQTITAQPCPAQTRCADVVEWTAGTCDDVRVAGPFATGVRTITYTKQSVVNPSQPRALEAVIWYPAPPGSAPFNSVLNGLANAPLDNSGGPYPVIMFSHGSCGFPTQSNFLWPLIASRGFIVVAPPHPGNTLAEYPTCGTPTAQLASAQERPSDIIFVLDQVLADNANPASPLHGGLDATRIAMAGHSFGGFTTYLVVGADPRFKVALPMAPAVPGAPVLTIPSLTMLGQIDSVVDLDKIRTAYTSAQSPKYSVEIANAGHFAFSDNCFPGPDCNPPITLSQSEAHAVVLRWVVPFLEKYLAGHDGFDSFLTPPSPVGVLFDAS